MRTWMLAAGVTAAIVTGVAEAKTYAVEPGPQAEAEVRGALQTMQSGDTLRLGRGRYEFQNTIEIAASGVTIRGRGADNTVISFLGQAQPGPAARITASGVTLEGLAFENAKGVAVKAENAARLTIREVRAEWTGGPGAGPAGFSIENGESVLLDRVAARGAVIAGVHISRSRDVVVRDSLAERNGAGFVFENASRVELDRSIATRNGAGVAVLEVPGLGASGGGVRLFGNRITLNDLALPEGAPVPQGIGVVLTAARNVALEENEITNHGGVHVFVGAYAGRGSEDGFNPLPQDISIRENRFGATGLKPTGALSRLAAAVTPLPDVLWDGATNYVTAGRPMTQPVRIHVADNRKAGSGRVTTLSLGQAVAGAALEEIEPAGGIVSSPRPASIAPVSLKR